MMSDSQTEKVRESKRAEILFEVAEVTPLRSPRISGLKSQILKPSFLS